MVHTNDPQQSRIKLSISGYVENFVNIKPTRVRLTGVVGHPIAVSVVIVPEKKYPFKILEVKATDGQNIRYELTERIADEGKGYNLSVENTRKETGRYHDVIRLKTDSPIKPEIHVRVSGYVREK
jgi:hypothetical protein